MFSAILLLIRLHPSFFRTSPHLSPDLLLLIDIFQRERRMLGSDELIGDHLFEENDTLRDGSWYPRHPLSSNEKQHCNCYPDQQPSIRMCLEPGHNSEAIIPDGVEASSPQ